MKENRIICISREFGSGDHELGEHLSEKLGIKLFDSEIITKVAELGNVPEDFVEEQGEVRDFRGFLGVMPSGHAAADITRDFVVTSEKLFALQSIAIRQMAKEKVPVFLWDGVRMLFCRIRQSASQFLSTARWKTGFRELWICGRLQKRKQGN